MKKNSYRIFGIFIFLFCLTLTGTGISQVDVKMERIVKNLRLAASRIETDTDRMTLAIFPFQADDALVRKRIHTAVGEILMLNILEDGFFRLVERNELQRILDEQKLGMTGAVETETAARIGHLLGVRLAALGNVTRVGQAYQIVVKLVDTQTSEIVGAAVEDVPIKTFDTEADRYLVLVPEHQTIGLYCQMDFVPWMQVNDLPPSTFREITLTPGNPSQPIIPPTTLGVGFKYVPLSRWMIDLFIAFHVEFGAENKDLFMLSAIGETPVSEMGSKFKAQISGRGARLSINRILPIRPRLFGYAGMGVDLYELKNNENKMDTYDLGKISYDIKIDEDRKTYYFLFARLGFEWRIQDRFGLALFSQVYMWQDSVPVEATLIRNPATSPGTGRIIVYEFKTPLFMLGLTGSFYF